MSDLPKLPQLLNAKHLLAFGSIVAQFARFERQLEVLTCAFLGSQYGKTAMALASLGYSAKCDVVLSLTTTTILPPEVDKGIRDHLRDFNEYLGVRNAIAHHVWKEGEKPDTIKPVSIASRGGKGKLRGFDPGEPEYTAADLNAISSRLTVIHDSFAHFLWKHGLMQHMMK